jgi:hypothetical protein
LPTRSTGGSRRPAGPPPIAAPKPEPAASVPAATPPAPVAPLENTPPIQEIVPVEEQKKLQEAADNRKREIRQILDQAATRRLNHRETGLKRTIESYLKLFDQAEGKGDLRQANEIAERAWALAKDLQGGH